jgi:hypothetical protein
MASKQVVKVIRAEIERAAGVLGLPRQVSPAPVYRECFSIQDGLKKTKALFRPGKEHDRFLALADLFLLMDDARTLEKRIAALESDLIYRSRRVRKLVAKAAA